MGGSFSVVCLDFELLNEGDCLFIYYERMS